MLKDELKKYQFKKKKIKRFDSSPHAKFTAQSWGRDIPVQNKLNKKIDINFQTN
jgi:hypothetical protein